MDEDLASLVSEFQLDYRRQEYLRLFGDYWVLLRGRGGKVELWSHEHQEWQHEDALQDKFLFPNHDAAWEHYKTHIRNQQS